jgi:hypothetical protein
MPVVHEHTAASTRSTRLDRVVAAKEIRVGRELGQMRFDQVQAQRRVRHDRIEVGHQIVFGHDRDLVEVVLGDSIRLTLRQPLTVPWLALHRGGQQLAQAPPPLGSQSLCGPHDALQMLGQQPRCLRNVSLS